MFLVGLLGLAAVGGVRLRHERRVLFPMTKPEEATSPGRRPAEK